MKKKVFLCLAVSLMVFESMARDVPTMEVQKKNHSLIDFFRSSPKGQEVDVSSTHFQNSRNTQVENKKANTLSGNTFQSSAAEDQPVQADQVPFLSDKITESPLITEQKLEEERPPLDIIEENKIDEVFVNSFRGVTNLNDLLKNIQTNVESLTFGRMSNDDYNKLIQKKQKILAAKDQYAKSVLAYDKICAMEKVLMDYNSVSEISVHFLSDIDKQEINKVQEALFLSEVDSLGDGLSYTFKTQISDNLKNSISNIHKEIPTYEVKEFSHKLLKELEKIPNELLDPVQYAKVERLLKEIHEPVSGNFESKCSALKHLVESYNDLKSIPFRLKKISSESVKKLALKAIEDIFFEKMLNTLRMMDEEHFSATAENDAEALAALNIKKSLCKMLGGISYSGKEYKSNIEAFRTTDSLAGKQSLLKDSISQFNKTVDLFKTAVESLKAEGRHPKLKNIDEIGNINEDIDKIFEKIAIYDSNAKKESLEDVQEIIIEKNEVTPEQVSTPEEENNPTKTEAANKKVENKKVEKSAVDNSNKVPSQNSTDEKKASSNDSGVEEVDFSEDADLAEMEKAFVESEKRNQK